MKTKMLSSILLIGFAVTFLVTNSFAAKYTIRIANLYPENHPSCIQTHNFSKFVEEDSKGEVKVDVFCNNQLGTEREASEGLRNGTLEMVMSGGGGVGRFVKELYMLEMPYLYNHIDDINIVTWELIDEINAFANPMKFYILGFGYEGPRSINSVKPITKFSDMKGYKLRIPEAPLYVGLSKAMGAIPTPTAFTEAYTSLQTGVADGMECGPSTTYNNKIFEVAPYFVKTEHIVNPCYLAINIDFFNNMPENLQEILKKAGKKSTDIMLEDTKVSNDKVLAEMAKDGLNIIELSPEEKQKFVDALQPFNDEYAKSVNEEAVAFLAKIRKVLASKSN